MTVTEKFNLPFKPEAGQTIQTEQDDPTEGAQFTLNEQNQEEDSVGFSSLKKPKSSPSPDKRMALMNKIRDQSLEFTTIVKIAMRNRAVLMGKQFYFDIKFGPAT